MSELSIKITIGGRIYPITVTSSEEDKVRAAAKKVDDNLKLLQSSYAVKDKQDLLAMTALQFATEQPSKPEPGKVQVDEADLESIEQAIERML
jgi:cell division protein ZapA